MRSHGRLRRCLGILLRPWLGLLVLSLASGCELAQGLVRGTSRTVNTYDDPTRGVVPWETERYEATRSEFDRPKPAR